MSRPYLARVLQFVQLRMRASPPLIVCAASKERCHTAQHTHSLVRHTAVVARCDNLCCVVAAAIGTRSCAKPDEVLCTLSCTLNRAGVAGPAGRWCASHWRPEEEWSQHVSWALDCSIATTGPVLHLSVGLAQSDRVVATIEAGGSLLRV